MSRHRYTFGATEVARERLDLLARVFEAPSHAFLAGVADRSPDLALDLGCGPGHTTDLVRRATGARRTIGIDAAPGFVGSAAARFGNPSVEFVVADVTDLPSSLAPADLIYARFVLAHLPDVPARIARWISRLAPGGVLALDEVEDIDTDERVFRSYLDLARGVVASTGAMLYAGPLLGGPESRVVEHLVPMSDAARMFRLNLESLRREPWVVARRTTDELARLAAELDTLSRATGAPEVTWRLRQAATRR